MKNYDNVFNSHAEATAKFDLANGYISTTTVLFEAEKTAVKIHAKGYVEFVDPDDQVIASINIPEQTGGKEVYTEMRCAVENGTILLKFPLIQWIDNYPHCDGEHDRWDTKIVGYHDLVFDLQTKQITLKVF